MSEIARCSTFVPVEYGWNWDDHDGATKMQKCHGCHRGHGEHTHRVVETYSNSGPFMVAPPTIEELQ